MHLDSFAAFPARDQATGVEISEGRTSADRAPISLVKLRPTNFPNCHCQQ
jgi:hypothetical protein